LTGLALSVVGLLLLTRAGSSGALIVVALGVTVVAFGVGPLLDAARNAFTAGLNVVAAVGALIFGALAILAVATLRHVPSVGEVQRDQTRGIPAPGTDHDPKETRMLSLD
jgi:hypothetical protein